MQNAGAVQSSPAKATASTTPWENFFGHLKEELFHHVRFLNAGSLKAALHAYICRYENERISTKLKGLSPVRYRAQALAA
ncbi:MAG: integrase core domain-containing protein [Actinomycetota bacterium]